MKKGYVYLVGAGCGDMDLITLRGLNALRQCTAVVYDDLIDEALLEAAPENALRIYMGKRSGRHSFSQPEISQKLVDLALEGHTVVRLKGGDPFVFGRGGEEALKLAEEGISYEEVPGISSSIAIPAAAGIPVTHRGLSRSFHVITGHSADRGDGLPENLEQLAKINGTLIFLMGLKNLPGITEKLMKFGKAKDTPAAVLSGGNSRNPATVRGTLDNICDKVREAGVEPPAVIVIGEVAALELLPPRPLQKVRIGLTGTASIADKLKSGLKALGASVFCAEHSIVEKLPLSAKLSSLCDGKIHWIVFTSANGVRIFFEKVKNEKVDLRRFSRCKFAVIGASTGKLLEEHGIMADLCPKVYTSLELAKLLCTEMKKDEDAILFRAKKGAAVLPQMLRDAGFCVQDLSVYDLKADEEVTNKTKEILDTLDYITFSSGGGAELFFREYGRVPSNAVCVSIGEVTAKALSEHGCDYIMSDEISAEGMIRAIVSDHLKKKG